MIKSCTRAANKKQFRGRLIAMAVCGYGLVASGAKPAFAASSIWNIAGNGTWSTAADWAPVGVPNGGVNVAIVNGTSTVTLDISPNIGTLQVSSGCTLNTNIGTNLQLNGPSIFNGGTIGLNGALQLDGNLTLFGAGTFTMSGPASATNGGQIGTNNNAFTLTNQSTIQGSGLIGSNAVTYGNLNLTNSGTIDGNSTSNALEIGGSGSSFVNTGLLEATAGGTLILAIPAAINDNGGNITASGTGSVVTINATIQGGTLNTLSGGVIQTSSGGATLDATTQGAITLSDGSTYTSTAGTTFIKGTLNLGTTTGSTFTLGGALELTGNTTLSGPGVVNISGTASNSSGGQIGTNSNGFTLTNNLTIQGTGTIGSNNTTYGNLSLANNGIIDANTNGQTLSIQGTGGTITNTGTFEATSGGILNLATSNAILNSSARITASGAGSTVNISTTIQGGTLTTLSSGVIQTTASGATLDAASQGAINLSDGSTYTSTAGTTFITGMLNLGTTTGSTFTLGGALELTGNVTLAGPGVLNISGTASNSSGGQIGTNGNGYTLTNKVTIQGTGTIGSNNTTYGNPSLINNGTIDANTNGLVLSIQGTGGTTINTGTLEATSGGILNLATQSPIDNASANITANGTGSTVNVNTTIQGGTLNTKAGGVMQTGPAGAVLDSVTQGAITLSDGSTYMATSAALNSITGSLNLGTSTGSTLALSGQLRLVGNTTFAGPGVVSMTGNPSNSSGGQIGTNGNGFTLINLSLIQGSGLVGSNVGALYQNLNLTNNATIDANLSGQTLSVQGTGGTIINAGLLEATSGGILNLATTSAINNSAGSITANAGTVNITNTTIDGGILNTPGGGVMQTVGTSGLNGLSLGPITISDGSTYTSAAAAFTTVTGTLNLGTVTGGTLALSGQMQLVGNTTFTGPGTVTMTGNPSNASGGQIGTNGNGFLLTNQATIRGTGLLGSNAGSLYNSGSVSNSGSIIAIGGALTVAETGGVTNTGILQANASSTLLVSTTLTNYAPGTSTLTGGTYNAYSGIIQLAQANTTTSAVIATNVATILLDGASAKIADANGNNILQTYFKTNALGGTFTIQDGANLTSASQSFNNSGTMIIGANSTFTVGGSNSYLDSGTLEGTGTVIDLVLANSGIVHPGFSPGILTDTGNYTQSSPGNLNIQIGGANAGTGFSQLVVSGTAALGGTLNLSLINGFAPTPGEKFVILSSTGLTGTFSTVTGLSEGNVNFTVAYSPAGFTNDVVINATTVPEPSSLFPIAVGLAAMAFTTRPRRRQMNLSLVSRSRL